MLAPQSFPGGEPEAVRHDMPSGRCSAARDGRQQVHLAHRRDDVSGGGCPTRQSGLVHRNADRQDQAAEDISCSRDLALAMSEEGLKRAVAETT